MKDVLQIAKGLLSAGFVMFKGKIKLSVLLIVETQ